MKPAARQKKNAPILYLLHKSIALIGAEQELTRVCIEHPEIDKDNSDSVRSPFYWQGSQSDLIELISSLDYAKYIGDSAQRPVAFSKLVSGFAQFLNMPIAKPYILRADLAKRKKCLSVLLTKLKAVFEKNIVNCGI